MFVLCWMFLFPVAHLYRISVDKVFVLTVRILTGSVNSSLFVFQYPGYRYCPFVMVRMLACDKVVFLAQASCS